MSVHETIIFIHIYMPTHKHIHRYMYKYISTDIQDCPYYLITLQNFSLNMTRMMTIMARMVKMMMVTLMMMMMVLMVVLVVISICMVDFVLLCCCAWPILVSAALPRPWCCVK